MGIDPLYAVVRQNVGSFYRRSYCNGDKHVNCRLQSLDIYYGAFIHCGKEFDLKCYDTYIIVYDMFCIL